jgi:hypothetical protein
MPLSNRPLSHVKFTLNPRLVDGVSVWSSFVPFQVWQAGKTARVVFGEVCHIKNDCKKSTGEKNEIEIENGNAVFNWGEFHCDISLWWQQWWLRRL